MFENKIKCGSCSCEYDANLNNGCPQCGAGLSRFSSSGPSSNSTNEVVIQ